MATVEERLAVAEEKLKRMDKIEEELKKTQLALMEMASTVDRNFAVVSGRVAKKSDGFFSDLFSW